MIMHQNQITHYFHRRVLVVKRCDVAPIDWSMQNLLHDIASRSKQRIKITTMWVSICCCKLAPSGFKEIKIGI
jgi:hypothetical protein